MAHTNTAPGEAVLSSGYSTEDHKIRRGNSHPIVKANDKKKNIVEWMEWGVPWVKPDWSLDFVLATIGLGSGNHQLF